MIVKEKYEKKKLKTLLYKYHTSFTTKGKVMKSLNHEIIYTNINKLTSYRYMFISLYQIFLKSTV